MRSIDRKTFFEGYRQAFGTLDQAQVIALEFLLGAIECDPGIDRISWAAYMLATVKHETGDTYQPIREWGRGKGKRYGVIDVVTGKAYYGRGYVQLTWSGNYMKFGQYVGKDLHLNPDLALDPEIAYVIMSVGMREGLFTGRSLGDYLSGTRHDYRNARRIINGMDCADKIAGYAIKFEAILRRSEQ